MPNPMTPEELRNLARTCAVDYDLHCEAIDDPDIEKLEEMIFETLNARQSEIDALESKLSDLEGIDKVADHANQVIVKMQADIDALNAEIARLTAERDTARRRERALLALGRRNDENDSFQNGQ